LRIRLRPKKIADAKDDYAWQTDAELARLDAALTLTVPYQQYLSEYTFELCYPTANRHEFAIETLEGKHIGNCVYYNVDSREGKAEIGIMIGDRTYWNKGYGTEAIRLLLERIFNTTRLDKIYLTTLKWNVRAQKCFAKCGFTECGEVQRDGSDFLLMVIPKDLWRSAGNGMDTTNTTSPTNITNFK
jgi:RimJ/RimL family protein N-acetyltransferase